MELDLTESEVEAIKAIRAGHINVVLDYEGRELIEELAERCSCKLCALMKAYMAEVAMAEAEMELKH